MMDFCVEEFGVFTTSSSCCCCCFEFLIGGDVLTVEFEFRNLDVFNFLVCGLESVELTINININ